MNYLC